MTGRKISLVEPSTLPLPETLPKSWILAVLLCTGDSTEEVSAWARRLPPAARRRIWFYEAPTIDPARAYAAWREAGLGSPLADAFSDFLHFNRLFGNDLNEQIYQDFSTGP